MFDKISECAEYRRRADEAERSVHILRARYLELSNRFDSKRWSWYAAFSLGMLIGYVLFLAVYFGIDAIRDRTPQQEAVERLLDAAKEAQEALR